MTDLLVVGGPTHAFSMSRPETRDDAAKDAPQHPRAGIREWLQALTPPATTLRLATFDTRQGHSPFTGSAAKAAAKAARSRGLRAEAAMDFFVTARGGPLEPGEIERATEWGRSLAR